MKYKKLVFKSLMLAFFIAIPLISSAALDFSYSKTTVAEGWNFGQDEYWHLVPVNEKSVFDAGEKVQFFAQVGPIYTDHQWRLKLYLNNDLYREITNDPSIVDPYFGWNYSNFVPFLTLLPIGDYRAEYYLDIGQGFEHLDNVSFTVVVPDPPFRLDHAVTAAGWAYGEGQDYWNLWPVDPKDEFTAGDKVYLLVQTRNIYLDHRYKVELYRGDTFLWDYTTGLLEIDGGWVYSNFYPFYENARPGSYEFKTYIDTGDGFKPLAAVPFTVTGIEEDYVYDHTYIAAGWEYGSGTDYWNLQPVDQRDTFEAGETVYALSQVRNIYVDHAWKIELYRQGTFLWDYETSWLEVGEGWTFGNFYPFYSNAQPGEYEFRVYINTGGGFDLLDTKNFTVTGQIEDYIFDHATVAAGWEHGTGADYWNLKPVDPRTQFTQGEDVYLVAQVRNIYVDHSWKIELYREGHFQWDHETPINNVSGSWTFGNFYPYYQNAQPGNYEFKVYIDAGSGYVLLSENPFTVQ